MHRLCTRSLLASTALGCAIAVPGPALAQNLPTGASIAAGSVMIAQPSAAQLNITQSSQSAVVNYQSFSVGQGSSVNFAQPNASSAILNRVTGNTSSNIAGQITANGQVYLVNPNGIAITRSGTVSVGGGFVASTLGISDSDFMAGKRSFAGNGALAGVSNDGTIRVGRGGYAALIGGTVSNAGSIDVPLGKVGLGSGERATLDFAGDGFLQVAMPTAAKTNRALIRNSGTIRADGGSVIISAATAREAARNAVNISGIVQARSISGHNGAITIGGGGGGRVRITGRLIATSRHYAGGTITVTGKNIKLKGATVNASGATGGGTINIGGDLHGSGTLQHADTVTIDAATRIDASATGTGNGGEVVVWSDAQTSFAGLITAKGGPNGGDGGQVEVSSHGLLDYTGLTTLTAPHGAAGTLLLDPYNVVISSGTDTGYGTTTTADGTTTDTPATTSVINANTLATQLGSANVTISTGAAGSAGTDAGNITVLAPVNWTSGNMLTLQAAGTVTLNADMGLPQFAPGSAPLAITAGGAISQTGGTLNSGRGVTVTLTSTNGSISQSNDGVLRAGTLSVKSLTGSVALNNRGNTMDTLTASSAATSFSIGEAGDLTTTGTVSSGGALTISIAGTLSINGALSGSTVSLSGTAGAGGLAAINGGGTVTAALLNASTAGAISLTGSNVISAFGTITNAGSGTVTLVDTTNVSMAPGSSISNTVGGIVIAVNGTFTNTGGAGVLSPASGSYYTIYTQVPSNVTSTLPSNTFGGLTGTNYYNDAYDFTSATFASAVPATTNHFVYGYAASLTYTANSASQVYGGTQATLSGTVSGLRSGDSLGTAVFSTTATSASNVGSYAITGSVLSNVNNYKFVQAAGNGTALTIGTRAITVAANAQSQVYGNATPTLTYTVGGLGLVNGDTLSGGLATGATATSNVGIYGITQGSLAASSNYAISYTGANDVIGTRAITITANAQSQVYGNATPALTYTVGGLGLVNGDTLSGGLATGATATSNVGIYGITQGSLAASSNYAISYTGANDVIGTRAITITANAQSQVYGNATPALTYTVGGLGLVNGDTLSGGLTTSASSTTNVGIYGITQGTLAASSNYAVSYTGANDVIGTRAITVAANAQSQVYGNATPTLTYTVGGLGLVNGDTLSGGLATTASSTANVGSYGITQGSLAASTNYAVSYTGANDVIGTRAITVAANAQSQVYGNATPTLTYTVGGLGLVNGDTLSGGLATGATATSNVGIYGITQGTLAASSNYAVSYTGANDVVGTRAITVAANAQTQVYGNATPALTYTVGGLGLVNGDTLSGGLATGATATSNVGSYGITQGSLAASTNYAVSYTGANDVIGTRAITVAANAQSQVYGNATPALTYTVGGLGLVNGDTLSGGLATGATATSNVGSYGITQGSLAASTNYAVSYTGANDVIGTRAITVAANAQSQVYGNATPALTYTVGGLGLVNGDTLSGGLATGATATSNVGIYGITQGSLAASSNYAISYTGANDVIGTRAITITANAQSQVYGNATPALTYTVGGLGLVNGDTLSGGLTTSASSTTNVGIYGITQGSLAASTNYAVSYTGANDVIGTRAITVAANAQSQVYGNATPALTYTVGGLGLVNGDTLSGGLATTASSTANVGSYGITQGSLAASTNYAVSYTGANDVIGTRAITVAANAQSQVYGNATPTLTYTVGGLGLVNGDTLSGGLATGATATSNVGIYGITQGTLAASSNYAVSYTGANDVIGTRAITVAANAQSQVYGNATPTLTYTVGGLGLVNGDTLSGGLATGATATSNVGSYGITQGTLAASSNYALTYAGANLGVTQRALTITADAQSRAYGEANPALTYTLGGLGLVNGDVLSGSLATSATASSNVGSYAITQGNLAVSPNYALTYVGALLTVQPAVQPPPPLPVLQGSPAIDPSVLASNVVRDNLDWIALPDGGTSLAGMLPETNPPGVGVFYSDPRFDRILVCFGGGVSVAASCLAVGR